MTKRQRKCVRLNPNHLEAFAIGVPGPMRAEIDKRARQLGVNPSELGRFVWSQALRKWRTGIKSHGIKWLQKQYEDERGNAGRLIQMGHLVPGPVLSGELGRLEEGDFEVGLEDGNDSPL